MSEYTEEQINEYQQQYQQQLAMAMGLSSSPSSTPSSSSSPASGDSANRNLIVNYIPQTYSENDLLELFKPYGEIESCKIVMDKLTGQSLGYGFVKFTNEQDASNAINGLNGTQIMSKTLKVSVAKPAASSIANLYISGLDPNIDEETLRTLFSPYGTVLETKILIDHNTQQGKGVGFIKYATRKEGQDAIRSLNNQNVPENSKPLHVKFAESSEEKKVREMKKVMPALVGYDPYSSLYAGYGFTPAVAAVSPALAPYYNTQATAAALGTPSAAAGVVPGAAGVSYFPAMAVNPMAGSMSSMGGEAPTLFVYNIPQYSDDNLLYQLFCPFGAISSVKIIRDESTQLCKGYGFVAFATLENAQAAILALNGYKLNGKSLQVSFKKSK